MKSESIEYGVASFGMAKILSGIMLLTLLFTACGATKTAVKPPSFKVVESTISKDIEDKESKALPVNPTASFSTHDEKVVSYICLQNLSGEHRLRWDWHKPNGELYYSTGNFPVKADKGEYIAEMTSWHRILLEGEEAENYPGKWQVNVYFDDQAIASDHFNLSTGDIILAGSEEIKVDTDKWGLIIRIKNYLNLPSVKFAESDTLLVKKCFTNMMGVPKENILCLFDADATKSSIEELLKNNLAMKVNKDTTLYVYYIGNGISKEKSNDVYIVPYDGDPRFMERTSYTLKKFYEDLKALNVKRTVVFIAGNQTSNVYPEKENGLFTYFMYEGLKGAADKNGDLKISTKELYDYVKKNIGNASLRTGTEQLSDILPSMDILGDIDISRVIK